MSDRESNDPKSSDVAAGICAAIILLVNAGLACSQFRDHFSWGAMQVVFFISPLVNGILVFASLLFAPADRESRTFYLSVAIALPLLLILCQLVLFVIH